MPRDERFEATVHGLVQGVFFRHNTRLVATRLGLTGAVRNRPDGTVKVCAEGPREQLDRLLAWLHHGPELAEVESVEVEWRSATREEPGFRIVR